MRRWVLVLFALALLCQGAGAAMNANCRFAGCCGFGVSAPAAVPHHAGDEAASDEGMPDCFGATRGPCDASGCNCDGPGVNGLLLQVPPLPAATPGAIVASPYLRHAFARAPDTPLRPPHTSAA